MFETRSVMHGVGEEITKNSEHKVNPNRMDVFDQDRADYKARDADGKLSSIFDRVHTFPTGQPRPIFNSTKGTYSDLYPASHVADLIADFWRSDAPGRG